MHTTKDLHITQAFVVGNQIFNKGKVGYNECHVTIMTGI